jgi:type III secretion protein L
MRSIAPLNRPTVVMLAGIEGRRRIIPAHRVAEVERIAAEAIEPARRIEQAELECREDLDRTMRAAWQRGFAQGHAEALEGLQHFLIALDARRRCVDAELLQLVMDAVTKILRRLPPALLTENMIEAALDEAQGERGCMVLRVNPERVTVAESWLAGRSPAAIEEMRVAIEPDAALSPDQCVLETPSGVIEVGLEVQLQAIRMALHAADEL